MSDRDVDHVLAPDVAGFGQRVLARLLDGLILLAPNLLVLVLVDGYARVVGSAVLGLLYEIPQLATWGQTLGKRAMGIRVVAIDTGLPPSSRQAFVRVVLPDLLFLSPAVTIADLGALWAIAVYLPLFFDPWRRGLHDRAAHTRVVRDA